MVVLAAAFLHRVPKRAVLPVAGESADNAVNTDTFFVCFDHEKFDGWVTAGVTIATTGSR